MKIFIMISRLIVGSLFIVSGLIKCNDTIGFSYKLNDYFAENVLNLEFLIPYSLGLAVMICVVEIVLGVALIFGFKSKLTTTAILLMMLFFTWLTWYTSSCLQEQELATQLGEEFSKNCVTDCGCFGDALKLKPIESFYKDVFLLIFTIPLFFAGWYKKIPVNTKKEDIYYIAISLLLILGFGVLVINWWFTVVFSIITYAVVYIIKNKTDKQWLPLLASYGIALAFTWYCLQHLPLKDFRAYKIGNNLPEQMIRPVDAPRDVIEYTWNYKLNGEVKQLVDAGSGPKQYDELINVDTEVIEEGYEIPIQDFSIETLEDDYTETYLNLDKLIIIAMYNLEKSEEGGNSKLKTFAQDAKDKSYKVIGLTASNKDIVNTYKQNFDFNFDFYLCDEKAIKTIIRSNPGVLVLEKGTVVNKSHWNDIEDIEL